MLNWAVPVLSSLAWHQGSTLALEPSLGSIILLCWGSDIVCLPWHAVGRECQQPMARAPWQAALLSRVPGPENSSLCQCCPFALSSCLPLPVPGLGTTDSIGVGLAEGCLWPVLPCKLVDGVVPQDWELGARGGVPGHGSPSRGQSDRVGSVALQCYLCWLLATSQSSSLLFSCQERLCVPLVTTR